MAPSVRIADSSSSSSGLNASHSSTSAVKYAKGDKSHAYSLSPAAEPDAAHEAAEAVSPANKHSLHRQHESLHSAHDQPQGKDMHALEIASSPHSQPILSRAELFLQAQRLAKSNQPALRRELDWRHLIFLGVGSTVGAGLYVVTGVIARNYTGPALFLSYVIAGAACTFAALAYSELAALSPSAGSAYAYARCALGELPGMLVGWDLCLEYGVASASVAQSWSKYCQTLLKLMHIPWPAVLAQPPWDVRDGHVVTTDAAFDLLALLITWLITSIVVRGIKESARVNAGLVFVKVLITVFVILAGLAFIDKSNYSPFSPYGFFSLSFFGHAVGGQSNAAGEAVGVMAGSALAFFSFVGFDSVSTLAEETKKPGRDLPIGVLGSLGIATILYCSVSLVLVGMVPYLTLDISAPISSAFGARGASWAEGIIAVGALVGLTSVLTVSIMGQPRILMAMSRDRLLPEVFSRVHPQYRTPHRSALLCGVLISLGASLIPLQILVELVSIGTLAAFIVVQACVIALRRTAPNIERPFRVPGVPYVPAIGMAVCLLMMLSLPATNWWRLLVWMGVGLIIYFGWSRRNAEWYRRHENQQPPQQQLEEPHTDNEAPDAPAAERPQRYLPARTSSSDVSQQPTAVGSLASTRRNSQEPMLPLMQRQSSDDGVRLRGASDPDQATPLVRAAVGASPPKQQLPQRHATPQRSKLTARHETPLHSPDRAAAPASQLDLSDHFAQAHVAAPRTPHMSPIPKQPQSPL